MACFEKHGLGPLLTCVPPFLLSQEVVDFYGSLKKHGDNSVTATVTLTRANGEEAPFTFDVRAAVRALFSLSHEGDSITSLSSEEINEAMRKILISGDVANTIYVRDIAEKVKMSIKVFKHTFLGMLRSRSQISHPQQRLLTALFGDYAWNWEDIFLNNLLEAAKTPQIRLGCKVSAIILHAAKDEDSSWPNRLDYTLVLLSVKEKPSKKKAATKKKAAAKSQTESSSSSSEGDGSQPQLATTTATSTQPQPTTTQPQPIQPSLIPSSTSTPTSSSSKWKPIPRPGGSTSSSTPSPRTSSHTPLLTTAELTSALASSSPPVIELTSITAHQATGTGLTSVSAPVQPFPHTDLSPVFEEIGIENAEEEEEEEQTNSDCQVTGSRDAHQVLLTYAQ